MTVIGLRLFGVLRIAFQLLVIGVCLISLPPSLRRASSAANSVSTAIVCPPIPSGGGNGISGWLATNADGSNVVPSGSTYRPPPGGNVFIHASVTTNGTCQLQNAVPVPGAGIVCVDGQLQSYGVIKIGTTFVFDGIGATSSKWFDLGGVLGKNCSTGATAFPPTLDTTITCTPGSSNTTGSTGPRGLSPSMPGVYTVTVGAGLFATHCNFTPTNGPDTMTYYKAVGMDNGCTECSTSGTAPTNAGKGGSTTTSNGPANDVSNNGGTTNGMDGASTSVGEPVNVITGNMYLDQTDFELPGLGAGLRVTRAYNSQNGETGLFGYGWSSNLEASAVPVGPNHFFLRWGDNSGTFFKRSGDSNEYLPLARRNWFAYGEKLPDNTYQVFAKGGLIYQFNGGGNLVVIKDRNNNQTTITRNATNQRIEQVTDAEGRSVTFNYHNPTDVKKVKTLTNQYGTIATYWYFSGLLTDVFYADGSKYKFDYGLVNSALLLTTVKDFYGNLLEKHEYYPDRKAKTSELDGGAEKYTLTYLNENQTKVESFDGEETLTTIYTIDLKRHRPAVTEISGDCACGGGGGNQTRKWTYNQWNEVETYTDGNNIVTSHTWDANGNPATMTDATGTTTYNYARLGDILSVADQVPGTDKGTLTYSRDGAGNLLSFKDKTDNIVSFGTPDSRGLPPSVTDPRAYTTAFSYTPEGRLWKVTDPLGQVTEFEYYPLGKLKKIINARGFATSYTYDAVGRTKTITEPAVDASGPALTTFVYDKAGRMTELIDPRGYKTIYGYDKAYRLITEKNALNHVTTYGYDLMSNLNKVTDALNRVTDIKYDGFGQVAKIIYPPAQAGATRDDEEFKYDAGGRLIEHKDQKDLVTAYQYDNANRPWKVIDAKQGVTEFGYNPRSFRTMVKDAKQQVYGFDFDKMGRPTTTTRAGITMTYGYQNGVRTSRTDYNGAQTNYQYDELNRLKRIAYAGGGETLFTFDEVSNLLSATNVTGSVSFGYDARNRVSGTQGVEGDLLFYQYDKNNNRKSTLLTGIFPDTNPSRSFSYTYDAMNRLQFVESGGKIAAHLYDTVNRLSSRSVNGLVTNVSYDSLDRVTALNHTNLGGTPLANFQYSYNAVNQITQMTDAAGAHTFGYDELQRLTSAAHPAGQAAESYNYDQVGNRTASHLASNYSYQTPNRVTQIGNTTLSYDWNGNLETKSDPSGTTVYAYDLENRLMRVLLPSGKVINYRYDALGRRVERYTSTGEWQRYTYDGWEVSHEESNDGSWVTYANGDGMDDHLWQWKGDSPSSAGTYNAYLTDHQASVRALTDIDGNIINSNGYETFGNRTGTAAGRFGYTGREHDPDTGLMYYRARWYDSASGRFISEDPIGFDGGDNWYTYVGNDPLNSIDPLGTNPWKFAFTLLRRFQSTTVRTVAQIGWANRRFVSRFGNWRLRKTIAEPCEKWMYKVSEVHHDLPRKYREYFEKLKIDIDHPALTRWVEKGKHGEWSGRYEKMWDALFANGKNPTKKEVIDLFKKVRDIGGKDSSSFPSFDLPTCP